MSENSSVLELSSSGALTRPKMKPTSPSADIREYQRRNSELQNAVLDLKLQLVNRENQFSKAMADGQIDELVIKEMIRTARHTESKDAEIRRLTAELNDAKQQIAELKGENARQKQVEAKLKSELQFATSRLQVLETERQSNHASSREKTDLLVENANLKKETSMLEVRITELVVQKLALESQLADSQRDHGTTNIEVSRLQAAIKDLKAKLDQEKERSDKLTEKCEINEREKTEAQQELDSVFGSVRDRCDAFEEKMDVLVNCVSDEATIMQQRILAISDGFDRRIAQLKESEHSAVEKMINLCAKLAKLDPENVPSVEDVLADPATLEFFIGRATTSQEMHEADARSHARKLELAAKSAAKTPQKVTLSPAVAKAIQGVQGKCAELTRVLHRDHMQLIEALAPSTYFDE